MHTFTAARNLESESTHSLMSKVLKLKLDSESDAYRLTKKGISARAYKRAAEILKFPSSLVASERTVRRRLHGNARFTTAETERVMRLVRVYAEAVQLFGDAQAALEWLNTPADYLLDLRPITPMALAASDPGARVIESRIRQTLHGIF